MGKRTAIALRSMSLRPASLPNKLWFYTSDSTQYEDLQDCARTGEGAPSYISDFYLTRRAAQSEMLVDINQEVMENNEEVGDVTLPRVRVRDIIKGVYDSADVFERRWTLQSRKVIA